MNTNGLTTVNEGTKCQNAEMRNENSPLYVGGIFDMIKSALPTIGKVAVNVMSQLVGDDGEQKAGIYTVLSESQNEFTDSGLHFIGKNGRILAVNSSLSNTYSINIPSKGNEAVQSLSLAPFNYVDVTENMKEAVNENIQRFSVMKLPLNAAKGVDGFGSSVLSCLATVTLAVLKIGKNISPQITLSAKGNDLYITLRVGLNPICAQAFQIIAQNGGEQKRFNSVTATTTENNVDGTGKYIVLKGALEGFKADDDLEILGDIMFDNVEGKPLEMKRGTEMTAEDVKRLSACLC